jgi:DNA-binding NtrC family response regulator
MDDIPDLVRHFVRKFAAEVGSEEPRVDQSFLERLQTYSWPGNVRELGNFMRRVLSLHQGVIIDAACFDREFHPLGSGQAASQPMPTPGMPISVLEKIHFENTLALTHGNRTHAAEMLGISLRTMRNKIKEYGLPPRRLA